MKICSVPYYNTLPLTWFLDSVFADTVLTTDYPANLANGLREKRYDIAMMPLGSFVRLENAAIVSDACIGCLGAVASVLIFSRKPLEQIKIIAIDHDSRTSAALGQILLREFFNHHTFQTIPFLRTDSWDKLSADAFLMIGDRALVCQPDTKKWPYRFDLGELWLEKSGLPFVFAAWITTNPDIARDENVISGLNKAQDMGQNALETIVQEVTTKRVFRGTEFSFPISQDMLLQYYRQNMVYTMTDDHRKAIELYFQLGRKYNLFT